LCLAIRWTMTVIAGLRYCDPEMLRRAYGNLCGLASRISTPGKNTVLETSV
jgi:hypothetical protein